jgi:prepilin-type N-terminal cleavage/methylation domain-containing protein
MRGGRKAFTLVELLIVVVILAILAGRAAPNVIDATTDAKISVMMHDEDALKNAIARYRGEHRGISPALIAGTIPTLINKTDKNGNIGTTAAYPYGPYLNEIPANSVNGVATVTPTTNASPIMTNKTGWYYNEPMGRIWGGLHLTGLSGGGGS